MIAVWIENTLKLLNNFSLLIVKKTHLVWITFESGVNTDYLRCYITFIYFLYNWISHHLSNVSAVTKYRITDSELLWKMWSQSIYLITAIKKCHLGCHPCVTSYSPEQTHVFSWHVQMNPSAQVVFLWWSHLPQRINKRNAMFKLNQIFQL